MKVLLKIMILKKYHVQMLEGLFVMEIAKAKVILQVMDFVVMQSVYLFLEIIPVIIQMRVVHMGGLLEY